MQNKAIKIQDIGILRKTRDIIDFYKYIANISFTNTSEEWTKYLKLWPIS